MQSVESGHIGIAHARVGSLLNVLKVDKGIVFGRVELNDVAAVQRWSELRVDFGEICQVGEVPVAVVDLIGSAHGQTFLVGFPALAGSGELVADGDAESAGGGGVRVGSVNVDFARWSGDLVGAIQQRRGGVGSAARDGAD